MLDSPEQAERAATTRRRPVSPIYGVPFRVAVLERNAGFAGANNAGAALARGRLLLLLNSDVLPDRPGWLGAMRDFYDATPDIGALGPKLLYEDDSIQHAGMYFHQPPGLDGVGQRALLQGHAPQPARRRTSPAPVPAVTGACMMIDRELYERDRRPARPLRAGRLRGLRPLPAPDRGGPRELVPARAPSCTTSRASPTRRTSCAARQPLQHVAAHAPLGRADRRDHELGALRPHGRSAGGRERRPALSSPRSPLGSGRRALGQNPLVYSAGDVFLPAERLRGTVGCRD